MSLMETKKDRQSTTQPATKVSTLSRLRRVWTQIIDGRVQPLDANSERILKELSEGKSLGPLTESEWRKEYIQPLIDHMARSRKSPE